ncbi:MAG: TerB family tellurite resistance protein [Pseudomonadota bacterium]
MIQALKALLGLDQSTPSDSVRLSSEDLPLATATLLVEMTRADHQQTEGERATVEQALVSHFSLAADEARALLEEAERETARAISLYDYTAALNQALDDEQRVKVLELLWRVALADGHLDKYEEYLVRKVADLLYVPHASYIRAKLAVVDAQDE